MSVLLSCGGISKAAAVATAKAVAEAKAKVEAEKAAVEKAAAEKAAAEKAAVEKAAADAKVVIFKCITQYFYVRSNSPSELEKNISHVWHKSYVLLNLTLCILHITQFDVVWLSMYPTKSDGSSISILAR